MALTYSISKILTWQEFEYFKTILYNFFLGINKVSISGRGTSFLDKVHIVLTEFLSLISGVQQESYLTTVHNYPGNTSLKTPYFISFEGISKHLNLKRRTTNWDGYMVINNPFTSSAFFLSRRHSLFYKLGLQ